MKRLISGMLVAGIFAGCSTIPQKEIAKVENSRMKLLKQVEERKKEATKKRQLVIDLKERIPVSVAILKVCQEGGFTCNVSDVPSNVLLKTRFRGTYSDFWRFLNEEFGVYYKKYGETYFFYTKGSAYMKDVLSRKVDVNVRDVSFRYLVSLISDYVKIPIRIEDTLEKEVKVSYFSRGKTLKQILDEITGQLNMAWAYRDKGIIISRYRSASFKLKLPFLNKEVELKEGGYFVKYKKDFFKNLEKKLKGILIDKNSRVSVTETGYVLAYARPNELRLLKEFVEKVNSEYTKEIPLKLTILAVKLNDNYSAGISFLDMKDLDKLVKTSNTTNVKGILDTVTAETFTLGVTSKAFDAVIEAISSFGKIYTLENSEFKALNGQPLVFKPVRKRRIVSNVSLNYVPVTGGDTTATTTQPTVTTETEDIEEGSNLLIVPYYVDEERIVVDLYREQSQIENLEQFNVNLEGAENTILLPTVKKDTAIQQTVLNKGEKVVLLSSVIDSDKLNNLGLPYLKDIPYAGLLAGKMRKEKGKYQLVIIVSYGEEE